MCVAGHAPAINAARQTFRPSIARSGRYVAGHGVWVSTDEAVWGWDTSDQPLVSDTRELPNCDQVESYLPPTFFGEARGFC
jgi:hypothetical protein